MTKDDLVRSNPLRILGLDEKAEDGKQKPGLVMARAGLGKTAVLVQVALDFMMREQKVLHVSIGETVDKARSWYDDIFSLISESMSEEDRLTIEPDVMRERMIMTFKESSFDLATLEERLDDLVKQDIYKPDCLIVDGYDFGENNREALEWFSRLQEKLGINNVWFSAVSHRNDDRVSEIGVPAPCHEVDDMFGTVLFINPGEDAIKLDIIKCAACEGDANSRLALNPSTMLIRAS